MQAYALTTPDNHRRVYLRAQIPMVAPDARKAWVHFTIDGAYLGHPDGAFEFNAKVNQDIIKNFNAQKNPVVMTYEHPNYSDGQPKRASGWVHELKWKDGGLWGYCEFTQAAAEMIKAGEYRFTSVVVDFDGVNRKTAKPQGSELFAVALTNSPFIDGQQPIALSWRGNTKRRLSMNDIDLKAALKALGLDESTSPEQAIAVLGHAMALKSAQEGKEEEPAAEIEPAMEAPAMSAALGATMPAPMAEIDGGAPAMLADEPAPEAGAEADAGKEQLASLLEQISGKDLPAIIAFIEDNKDAIAQMFGAAVSAVAGAGTPTEYFENPSADGRSQAMSRDELSVLRNTVKALSAKVGLFEKSERDAKAAVAQLEAEQKVDAAIASGIVPVAERQRALTIALSNTDFGAFISTLAPQPNTQMLTARTPANSGTFATDDEAELMKAFDTQFKYAQPDPAKRKELSTQAVQKLLARRNTPGANGRA